MTFSFSLISIAVDRLKKEYESEGYRVLTGEEASEALPADLRDCEPDLVIQSRVRKSIVKIIWLNESDPKLVTLSEALQSHPDWHLEVRFFDESSFSSHAGVELKTVSRHLDTARELRMEGQTAAALLLLWSVFEAAGKHTLIAHDIDPPTIADHASLLLDLAYYGFIDDKEYERLRRIRTLRNLTAHGILDAPLDPDDFDFLLRSAERLIGSEEHAA